jgi:hypothetical protein
MASEIKASSLHYQRSDYFYPQLKAKDYKLGQFASKERRYQRSLSQSKPFDPKLRLDRLHIDERIKEVAAYYRRCPSAKASLVKPPITSEMSHQTVFGPLILGAGEVISKISGKVSAVYKTTNLLQGQEDPIGLIGLEAAAVFGIVSGACQTYDGFQEEKISKKIDDARGRILGETKTVGGICATTSGAAGIPLRGLALISLKNASPLLGMALNFLSLLSTFLFVLSCTSLGVAMSVRLNEQKEFNRSFEAVLNDPQFPEHTRAERAMQHVKQLLSLTEEEKGKIRTDLQSKRKWSTLTPQQKETKIQRGEQKVLLKKERQFTRVTSKACVRLALEATSLHAESLLKNVQSEAQKRRILNGTKLALSILGVAGVGLTFALNSTRVLLAIGVISFTLTAGLLGLDIQQVIESFKESTPGKYDKLCVLATSALGFTAISFGVLLSLNPVAIACSIIVGLIWLSINLACFFRIRSLEQQAAPT